MKKTFILAYSLFAVSAFAQTEPLTLTTTFTNHVPGVESAYITGVSVECTDNLLTNGALAGASGNYVPNANIGNGDTWTATFSYTLSDTVKSLSISSIDISSILCTSSGVAHTNDGKPRGVVYTISINSTELGSIEWTGTGNGGDGGIIPVQTFTLTDAVTLTNDFTLTIQATEPANEGVNYQGGFIGLSSIELTGTVAVPEPATATLSLLALAGLAARRRRK